jgi:hypothetical protein
MTTQTTTTTQDWTEVCQNVTVARQAARSANVFNGADGWVIIDSGNAVTADAEQAAKIEAEMARFAAVMAEFGIEEPFEADAEAQAQAFSAEARSRWMQDCSNGFASF